jgi:superfamily II DNA/RNA helicase
MPFSKLGLSEKVLAAVTSAGYPTPTPIQEQAIPHVLARRDVLGIAQTGTGKTAAFVLPMLTMLEKGRARARMPRTLILEPTRELAAQVEESFDKYGKNHKLNVALIIGGVSFDDQDGKLMRGVDVLIATPGRLLDHSERGRLLMSGVELLVIDEADRMLDMGFIPDIERICKLVPFTRQTLFFTATMPPEIQRITEQFLHNPVRVEVSKPATTVDAILQQLVKTGRESHDKRDTLRRMIRAADSFKNAIIFCNRKREVAQLHRSLVRHGFNAVALHGDLDQSARTAALDAFRSGEAKLLIASDVAARGLDIPDVSHVFNFDVPHHADDYVHRIGRTGRAGKTGTAYTIVGPGDGRAVAEIEKLIGQSIPWAEAPAGSPAHAETDVQPHDEAREPRRDGRGGGSRNRHRGGQRNESRGPRREERAAPDHSRAPQDLAPQAPAPQHQERQPAPVARIDEARHRHAPPRQREREPAEPSGGDHLPAFLLRPVRGKA